MKRWELACDRCCVPRHVAMYMIEINAWHLATMCHGVRTLTLINYVHETILRARALMLTAGGLNGTEHAWFCRLGPLFCRHAALCPPPSVYVGPIAVTLTDVSTYTILLPNRADSPGRPVWKIMCVSGAKGRRCIF
jgi:hypothetical protein